MLEREPRSCSGGERAPIGLVQPMLPRLDHELGYADRAQIVGDREQRSGAGVFLRVAWTGEREVRHQRDVELGDAFDQLSPSAPVLLRPVQSPLTRQQP
jgi:hypothetical protein